MLTCVAFFTNDPVCAAVSCETLNIEQAEQDVKGSGVGASLSTGGLVYFNILHYGVSLSHAIRKACVHLQESIIFDTLNLRKACRLSPCSKGKKLVHSLKRH